MLNYKNNLVEYEKFSTRILYENKRPALVTRDHIKKYFKVSLRLLCYFYNVIFTSSKRRNKK